MNWRRSLAFGLIILASVLTFMAANTTALACASCGSGGDDPLILYPNEWLKTYLGFTQANAFHDFDAHGHQVTAGGPTAKQTITAAIGYGISPRSFVTLTQPLVRNVHDGDTRTGAGDPSLAGRYSLVLSSFDEPYLPQVQILAGYKHAQARSIHESHDLKTQLDVFGTGFSELKTGVDVWFGIPVIKPGLSQTFSWPQERSFAGHRYHPGLISRTTFSLGYQAITDGKVTFGINREERQAFKIDGAEQQNSTQLNHSLFLSWDMMTSEADTIRITASRQAAVLENENTSRSDNFGLAYMHSF